MTRRWFCSEFLGPTNHCLRVPTYIRTFSLFLSLPSFLSRSEIIYLIHEFIYIMIFNLTIISTSTRYVYSSTVCINGQHAYKIDLWSRPVWIYCSDWGDAAFGSIYTRSGGGQYDKIIYTGMATDVGNNVRQWSPAALCLWVVYHDGCIDPMLQIIPDLPFLDAIADSNWHMRIWAD